MGGTGLGWAGLGLAHKVLPAREVRRQLEAVLHVGGAHDLVGPLAPLVVELVDLNPAGADARRRRRAAVHGPVQEVRDGARVRRLVPLHRDGVPRAGRHRLHTRPVRPVYVADYVVARYVGLLLSLVR